MIALKRIKHLGINLTKKMKDLHIENTKCCWKKLKTQINGKTFCVHGLDDLLFLRCQYYPSPVVRTQCFHFRGTGSIPGQGTEILQATSHGHKKKNPNDRNSLFSIYLFRIYLILSAFPGGSDSKESACNAGVSTKMWRKGNPHALLLGM